MNYRGVYHLLQDTLAHDLGTACHQEATRKLATVLARRVGLASDHCRAVGAAAAIHDVGKLYIARWLLNAPRRLTTTEWMAIHTHPLHSAALADEYGCGELAPWVAAHHERLDGSGYPYGIAGTAIPLEARIVAVVDTWDAIVSGRPYAAPRSWDEARAILRAERGRLGADVVDPFLTQTATMHFACDLTDDAGVAC